MYLPILSAAKRCLFPPRSRYRYSTLRTEMNCNLLDARRKRKRCKNMSISPTEDNAPGWKANHYPRRKVHKGWLAAVVLGALLFFCIGISLPRWTLPVPAMREVNSSPSHSAVSKPLEAVQPPPTQILMSPPKHTFYFFMNPTFTAIATNEVATAIHLTPEQITIKIVNANYVDGQ